MQEQRVRSNICRECTCASKQCGAGTPNDGLLQGAGRTLDSGDVGRCVGIALTMKEAATRRKRMRLTHWGASLHEAYQPCSHPQ